MYAPSVPILLLRRLMTVQYRRVHFQRVDRQAPMHAPFAPNLLLQSSIVIHQRQAFHQRVGKRRRTLVADSIFNKIDVCRTRVHQWDVN
jgi:hypothetical protein